MKSRLFLLAMLAVSLFSCKPEAKLSERDVVYTKKRDLLISDDGVKARPVFVSLPAGAVTPQGWIGDWATDALNGITGHLDEWHNTYKMAWKGVDFEAEGIEPNATGWPLEQAAYWLDGGVRLAYIMNDQTLISKITERLDMVVDGVLNGGKSFIYWTDVDYAEAEFNNWAHSHMGRALVAYYEATGNPRILEALVKVYSQFWLVPLTYHNYGVSGANNADPMLATYELSGDKRILENVQKMAADPIMQETVGMWNEQVVENGHGVVFYENLRVPATIYPYIGNQEFLAATQGCFDWLDSNHMQPYGIASSEERNAGKGSTRNTETCNVASSQWSYLEMYGITGSSDWGDRIERVFFNAGAPPVSRDYKTMAYFQSPNRIQDLLPRDIPGHPADRGGSSYEFRPHGHTVLCCVGNLTRVIPFYVQHMWMGTLDKGIAATLYGPSVVNSVVGDAIPVQITTTTDYPFTETINMTVKPGKAIKFPLYLRIPAWTNNPQIKVNGEDIAIDNASGFAKIDRIWKEGDAIELNFPMHVAVTEGRETPYPDDEYFQVGSSAGRGLAFNRKINSPFRYISYGPLLFSYPVKDVSPNEQDKTAKWNYALITSNGSDVKVDRSPMPAHWSWQIAEAPVTLTVKAGSFNWQPTEWTPIPEKEVAVTNEEEIKLIPYGCTKFRISMFPVAKQ